jgi:dTDP-4-dehydrorhamnose reductase
LDEIAAHACEPDLIGWNWYPHSERFIYRHDGATADVPALYVQGCAISPRPLLRAAHRRLGLPQAISEVHVHAPEEERARWLRLRYDDALALRSEGVSVEAVGAWAAFGTIDWHSLLRKREGVAEDGVFTFSRPGETPRETAVARLLRALVRGEAAQVVDAGWWERDERFHSLDELARRSRAGIPDGFLPAEAIS